MLDVTWKWIPHMVYHHVEIAICFFFLGIFVSCLGFVMINRKVKYDYDIAKGDYMRLFVKGKKYFIYRPDGILTLFDIVALCVFDKGQDKIIGEHTKRRARIISVTIFIVLLFIIFYGFMSLLLPAQDFEWMNDM